MAASVSAAESLARQPDIPAAPGAAGEASTVIALRRLGKQYDRTQVLKDIDLDIRKGEFLTLLGPSGSGKTTLLNLIAGITLPSTGTIELGGRDISHVPPERRGIGMVFQNYALFPHLNVHENVAFPLKMRGFSRSVQAEKVAHALALVKLGDFADRGPSDLSGGQQQRVALARALVFDPQILLMDEPLSALDKKLRDHMKAELKQIQEALRLTIVYVTHDQGEALALSSRIAVMKDGRILQLDTPTEIYERPRTRFVADFVGEANLFDAHMLGTDTGRTAARLAAGPVRANIGAPAARVVPRQELVLVRPEHVLAGRAARNLDTRLRARVIATVYEGASRLLRLEAGGKELRARIANSVDSERFVAGQDIDIGWSSAHAHNVEADEQP